ncbi:hypothetical protein N9A86_05310 [Akkermansiaceae bacterium]|nr:hypothetical protein [Akkermansiaceae bacterium]
MALYGKTSDPVEEWARELIAVLPEGLGLHGSEFSTVSMVEEALGIYLTHEQDPYWGAESLAEYLSREGIPVPRHIVTELLSLAKPSPASYENIEFHLKSNDPDMPINQFIGELVSIPH